jgi:hypothetical protein
METNTQRTGKISRTRKIAIGLGLGAMAAVVVPVAAGAATTATTATTAPSSTPATTAPATAPSADTALGRRLERACARVPNLTARLERTRATIEGDASTRGSLAWLQAQIDKANRNGHAEAATVLENALATRTARLDLVTSRQTSLASLAQLCTDKGA